MFKSKSIANAFFKQNEERILEVYQQNVLINNTLDINLFQYIIFDSNFIEATNKLITKFKTKIPKKKDKINNFIVKKLNPNKVLIKKLLFNFYALYILFHYKKKKYIFLV